MKLIEDWRLVLKRSYTLWLAYIMLGSGMAAAAVSEFDLMPEAWSSWVVWALKWVVFICTLAQIPARVTKQASIPNK